MNNEIRWKLTLELTIIMVITAILSLLCRIWILFILALCSIIAGAILLLILSRKEKMGKVVQKQQQPNIASVECVRPLSNFDLAYSVILSQITERVFIDFPGAQWVWEQPNAKHLIKNGESVYILLNQAGGYRRAKALISNLQLIKLEFQTSAPKNKDIAEKSKTDISSNNETEITEQQAVNYERLAFEWVEAHILKLNERCNEGVAQGQTELILTADKLPFHGSWMDICRELKRNEFCDAECIPQGIKIKYCTGNAGKESKNEYIFKQYF